MRQDDAARARLRPAGTGRRHGPRRTGGAHAPARPAAAVAQRDRQRRPRAEGRRRFARRRAASRPPAVRRPRPRGLRERPPARAVGRHAPARRVPADAAVRQAGAVPRRAVRRPRRAHPSRDAGMARGRPRARAADGPARHARRRGGGGARRPGRRALAAAGPRRGRDPGRARSSARRHRPGAARRARAGAGGAAGVSGAPAPVPAPPARDRGAGLASRVLAPALLVALLVAAWELYARLGSVDDFILPAPSEIAQALWTDRALLWSNLLVTAQEVGLGILVSLVLGFGLAVALHFSGVLRRSTYPLLVASQAVPIVIVAPLLVVWFGFGIVPKLTIIALVCFFPVVVTTLDALGGVDPDQLKLLRTLDASRWQAFRWAEPPAALPAALSGAKIAVAVAVIGAVFAEYAGSSSGLGHLMLQAIPQLETSRAYAAVVLLAAFAVALFSALGLAERRLVPWANRRQEGPNRS